MLKNKIQSKYIAIILSALNLILYHQPVYKFIIKNLNSIGFDWALTIFSITVLILSLNALIFYIIFFISKKIGKLIFVILFNLSAIAVYFINTYGVIIDKTMIGNVLNTNFEESSSFFFCQLSHLYYFVRNIS